MWVVLKFRRFYPPFINGAFWHIQAAILPLKNLGSIEEVARRMGFYQPHD
jgi:hypothetical protein